MFWEDLVYAFGGVLAVLAALWVILYTVRTLIPTWKAERIRQNSGTWPRIAAKLDHACVTEYRPDDTRITYRLDAWFHYTVDEKIYDGLYFDEDMRLDEAKRLLRQLNHQPLLVSYNPKKPAEYFFEPAGSRSDQEE